jgi:hypothetical protein
VKLTREILRYYKYVVIHSYSIMENVSGTHVDICAEECCHRARGDRSYFRDESNMALSVVKTFHDGRGINVSICYALECFKRAGMRSLKNCGLTRQDCSAC